MSLPSQLGCHLPNSAWAGKIKLFPARESLVYDIPAGDRDVTNLFYVKYYNKKRSLVLYCTSSFRVPPEFRGGEYSSSCDSVIAHYTVVGIVRMTCR
jgi:hypothetical protein